MKEEVAFLHKVFLTTLRLGLTTAAATAFMVFIASIAFVLPLDETLVWLLIYGAYASSFALGVYWCRTIWRATGVEADNVQRFESTLLAFIVPFFCAVVGAVICTYVGLRMHIQLPHIITNAILKDDQGKNTLMDVYPLIGIIAGLYFWLTVIDKKHL